MDIQSFSVYISGFMIVFFYVMSRFNSIPRKGDTSDEEGAGIRETIRQWFHYKDLPAPRISPPLRANTTAFKYWLYRLAYAMVWVVIYTAIIRIPGIREPIPAIIKIITGNSEFVNLNLTNGVVVAFVIILLTRIPPFRGMDATFRYAMYEHASIPAQQLGFQYLLRDAGYAPDAQVMGRLRKAMEADGFDVQDVVLDPAPTTRSLWTKACLLIRYVERWGKDDHYKTALALLHEPGSEKLVVDRVRSDFGALKSDARICLEKLKLNADADETRLRDQQFRRDCKDLLEAIYSLFTHVALRSHYSYSDAIASVENVGFEVEGEGAIAPLPDKNDVVALSLVLFFVTTIPLIYRVGIARALTITAIYVLAILTPIYLAAECPRLLKRNHGKLPPLAFPLVAGLIAGILAALVSIGMGSFSMGGDSQQILDFSKGIDRLVNRSYPWISLQCVLTMVLAVLMMNGEYVKPENLKGYQRYQRWGNIRDALLLCGAVFCLMALFVIPELHKLAPQRYPESEFWRVPGLLLRPMMTSFFVGFFVPTWYRGNAVRIREAQKQQDEEPEQISDGLALP